MYYLPESTKRRKKKKKKEIAQIIISSSFFAFVPTSAPPLPPPHHNHWTVPLEKLLIIFSEQKFKYFYLNLQILVFLVSEIMDLLVLCELFSVFCVMLHGLKSGKGHGKLLVLVFKMEQVYSG